MPTPAHTGGHLSVAVEDGETVVFLAGDASYSQRLMLEGRSDGIAAIAGPPAVRGIKRGMEANLAPLKIILACWNDARGSIGDQRVIGWA